jgi:hypothetical protein
MALTWTAKAPGAVYRYSWTPALADGDGLASYTVSASGATIDSEALDGEAVVLFVSGGTAATTATFTFTAVSDQGEEFSEKVYLPIVAPDATGMTVRDVCEFALRKVYGKDETPEASALSDARERLDDMLRAWGWTGADVGASFPLADASVLYVRPEFQQAIKANLILEIADLYDLPISIKTAQNALRGMQLIKSANLSDERPGPVYY